MSNLKLLKVVALLSFLCCACFSFDSCSNSNTDTTYTYSDYMYNTVYALKGYGTISADDLSDSDALSSDTLANVTSSSTDTFSNSDSGYEDLAFSFKDVELSSVTFTITSLVQTLYFNTTMSSYASFYINNSPIVYPTLYSYYCTEQYSDDLTLDEGESTTVTLYYDSGSTFDSVNGLSCTRLSWNGLDSKYARIGVGLYLYTDSNFDTTKYILSSDTTKYYSLSNFSFEFE